MAVPPPAPSIPMDKRAMRAAARARRDAFALTAPPPILVPAAYRARLVPGIVVAGYVPVGGEADPAPLVAAARSNGCTLALPRVVDRVSPIDFAIWEPTVPLVEAAFGLMQPSAHAAAIAPDIILVPLVAFDPTLARLGQGAGHYDRVFGRYPAALRLGVAWSVQQVAALPTDPWDVPLHGIVTERELLGKIE